MRVTFVSNYINHHQIPFCDALSKLLAERAAGTADCSGENATALFTFIQTQAMETDRVRMGWHEEERPAYVKCYYEEEEICKKLIAESDVVIFGGVDDESYITERLQAGKLTFRYCERMYKTGQWKAISPRGLLKKYHDHTRYRKAPVYLLCAGAYVASDYHIIRAYPGKMYCWGYFPETKHYDVDKLLEGKGYVLSQDILCENRQDIREGENPAATQNKIPHLLWAGRMIDWKHPELALETAKYLKDKKLPFHLDMVGGGELQPMVECLREEYGLQEEVSLLGFRSPEEVRSAMEKADIFLFTSDRQEGWGAVANEAMNSACAVVADHMIGAVPYLIQNGENGLIYRSGNKQQLFEKTEMLVKDAGLCKEMGRAAYQTITTIWNAENAATQLVALFEEKQAEQSAGRPAPGKPAPILSERVAAKLADA